MIACAPNRWSPDRIAAWLTMLPSCAMRELEHAGVVRLTLEPPVHGWLDVTLEVDDFVLREPGSWVINDPLCELVDAGPFLARGEIGARRVFFYGEPGGYVLDLENVDGTLVHLRVGTRDHSPGVPASNHPLRMKIERATDAWTLARAIREAVDDLFERVGSEEALPGWRDPRTYAPALAELRRLTRERHR